MQKSYPTKVVIPYSPRPCQETIQKRLQEFRFLVAVCHRRFGKTVSGVMWLILEALSGIPDFRGYYIAPNQKQAKRLVWNYFKKFLANFHDLVNFNETELRIDFYISDNKPSIYLAGSENIEALRGIYIDRAVLDEMASWDKAEYAFYEVIYPAMSDRLGKGFIIGTVKGLDLFYDLFQMGGNKKMYPDWDQVLFPVTETGVFSPEQIAELRRMMRPDAFAREYMCDFFAEAPDRLITPQEVEDAIGRDIPDQNIKAHPEVWGYDPGYTGDPAVLVKRKGPLLKSITSHENKDSVFQAGWLKQQIDIYKPKALYIDAGYGEGVIAQLNDLGYAHIVQPIFFNNESPSPGCVNIRAYMYLQIKKWLQTASIPRNENLVKQLSNVLLDDSDPSRRLKLKKKKDIKEVIRMSPNESDALGLTLAGGNLESFDMNDLLSDPNVLSDEKALREVLKIYAPQKYDPDNHFDSMYGQDIISQLDSEFNPK